MLKRLITGAVYVGVIVGFFFLRIVDVRLFGILIYAFSLIGTWEMVHAFNHERTDEAGNKIPPAMRLCTSQQIAVYIYAILFTPTFYIVEHFVPGAGYRGMLVLSFTFGWRCSAFWSSSRRRPTYPARARR